MGVLSPSRAPYESICSCSNVEIKFRYREPSKKLYRVPTRLRPFIILMSVSVVIFKVLNEH